jgi:hypothetical protein
MNGRILNVPLHAILIAAALLGAINERASGQTYTCLPASDSTVIPIRDYVVKLVTGTDSATVADRIFYALPSTTANKVTVVGSGTVCSQAGAAYHQAIRPLGTPAISRILVVIKVSTTRIVVRDWAEKNGEFVPTVVFDKNWVRLKGWDS